METKSGVEELDFRKYWLILRRHWLPASSVFKAVVVLTVILAVLQKPTYVGEGKLLLKKRDAAVALLTPENGEQKPGVGELEALNALNTPLDTEAEVIRTTPLITEVIQRLSLKDKQGKPRKPEDVLEHLTTKGIKGADVLVVSYKSSDPQEVAVVVNTLMAVYIENNILINRTEATAAREFISRQLPKTETILRDAEGNLRDFKKKNNVIALKDEATEAVRAIADFNSQIAKTQTQLADAAAQSAALQDKIGLNPQDAIPLNSLSQSSGVQQVLEEYQKIETQLAVQLARFKEPSPAITLLERKKALLQALLKERAGQVLGEQSPPSSKNFQLDKLKQALIENLIKTEVTRQGLINQLASLSQTRFTYIKRANILPQLEQVQQNLERQVATATSNYDVLVKRLQEVKIAENQTVGNARIISPAKVPEKQAISKKRLVLGGGGVLGGLLYIVTAFLMELRDPSIKTVKDIRERFQYTLLGLIPSLKKSFVFSKKTLDFPIPELPVRDHPHSLVSEAYRMLQANLKFLSPDRTLKTIVVTSSVSKEGKSTVSANLAIAIAQMGRRVLLVDADLRCPVQHRIWALTNAVGLSNIIVGQADLHQAIEEVMPNLDVLPSGAIPPNPLALIDSRRMISLIDSFAQDYDFVIFDTPPLVLVADAPTLSRATDGILLVARPGVIDTASVKAAKELLVQSGQRVLGLVINGVLAEDESNSYLHHAEVYHKGAMANVAASEAIKL